MRHHRRGPSRHFFGRGAGAADACAPPGGGPPLSRPARRIYWRARGRLQWRLFGWFAVGIVLTAATAWGVFALVGDRGAGWRRQFEGGKRVLVHVVADAWDDPARRRGLAETASRELGIGVRFVRADGVAVEAQRFPEECRTVERLDIGAGRAIEICLDAHRAGAPGGARFVGSILAALFVLWVLAGLLARRIARPVAHLARVAEEIGSGNLASRAQLRHGTPGEIGELSAVVHRMAERIEKQLGDQRALLAAVSHELRSPLTRVRLLVELARERELRDRALEEGKTAASATRPLDLDKLEREVVEMDALVGDLLAASRLDFAALAPKDLDVRELVEDLRARAEVQPLAVRFEGEPGTLKADPTLLGRALLGLLRNAARHGGPNVELRVRDLGARVAFEVEDDGPGLAAGEEERVFEPFYRGGASAGRDPTGVGLGLALVRRIAEAHGGSATVERLARGVRFVVVLPRAVVARA